MNVWQTLAAFVCGSACAVIIIMIVFYLWIHRSFRSF